MSMTSFLSNVLLRFAPNQPGLFLAGKIKQCVLRACFLGASLAAVGPEGATFSLN